jgi:Helix-turn-helix of insertion element transposase
MALKNKKMERAAHLVSEDRLTDTQISESVGVTRTSLVRWKHKDAFAARVEELTQEWADRALQHGYARRSRRLEVLSGLVDDLLKIKELRGTDPELAGLWNGAGATGLVVKTLKGIGKDDSYKEVEVREVDTGVSKEIRCLLDQIAQEAGQHVTQVNVTVGLADAIAEGWKRVEQARNTKLLRAPAATVLTQ